MTASQILFVMLATIGIFINIPEPITCPMIIADV